MSDEWFCFEFFEFAVLNSVVFLLTFLLIFNRSTCGFIIEHLDLRVNVLEAQMEVPSPVGRGDGGELIVRQKKERAMKRDASINKSFLDYIQDIIIHGSRHVRSKKQRKQKTKSATVKGH